MHNLELGTVFYASPEAAAECGVRQNTDIWSAGVVVYIMLCGELPFKRDDDLETLELIAGKPKVRDQALRCGRGGGAAQLTCAR